MGSEITLHHGNPNETGTTAWSLVETEPTRLDYMRTFFSGAVLPVSGHCDAVFVAQITQKLPSKFENAKQARLMKAQIKIF